MEKITVNVEGMMCGKCTARIEETMGKMGNVEEVKCDLEAKTVTVTSAMSLDEVTEAIEDMGFDVV